MKEIIKSFLFVAILILTLTSCSNGEDKMKIISYGTSEFEEFVKKAPIKLDEAWEKQISFFKNNYNDKIEGSMDYNQYIKKSTMYFIVDEYYVYTLKPLMKTKPKGKLLNGIWVSSITGDAKYNNNKTIIEAKSFYGYSK